MTAASYMALTIEASYMAAAELTEASYMASAARHTHHPRLPERTRTLRDGERDCSPSPPSLARTLRVDLLVHFGRDGRDDLRRARLARLAPSVEVERLAVLPRAIRGGDGIDLLVREQPARALRLRVTRVMLAKERTNERLADLFAIRCASETLGELIRRDGLRVLGHDDALSNGMGVVRGKPSLNAGVYRHVMIVRYCLPSFDYLVRIAYHVTSRHAMGHVTNLQSLYITNVRSLRVTTDNIARTDNTSVFAHEATPPYPPWATHVVSVETARSLPNQLQISSASTGR